MSESEKDKSRHRCLRSRKHVLYAVCLLELISVIILGIVYHWKGLLGWVINLLFVSINFLLVMWVRKESD